MLGGGGSAGRASIGERGAPCPRGRWLFILPKRSVRTPASFSAHDAPAKDSPLSIRVFISHSSGGDSALVNALRAELEGLGYVVLLDQQDITTGSRWRERIHAFLADCHASVILFSRRALDQSDWVFKEATVLAWRAALDPSFKLVPILLPGVTAADFQASRFGPLALSEIQHQAAADAAAIAAIVHGVVGTPTPFSTPLDLLRVEIADQLSSGGVGDGILEAVCASHLGVRGWQPGEDRKRTFARLLSEKIFRADRVMEVALEVLGSLRPAKDVAARIVAALAPLWVEPDAAGQIPPVARRKLTDRDVALNGALPGFTAPNYVARAYPLSTLWMLIPVDDSDLGDFVGHVAERVRAGAREKALRLRGQPDALVDLWLKSFPYPFFVLLPRIPPDEASLRELRALFPNVTYIIPTQERLPAPGELYPGVRCLLPELDPNLELAAYLESVNAEALGFASSSG
jgi:hypothetical protein